MPAHRCTPAPAIFRPTMHQCSGHKMCVYLLFLIYYFMNIIKCVSTRIGPNKTIPSLHVDLFSFSEKQLATLGPIQWHVCAMRNENVLLGHRMQLRYLPTAATLLTGFVPHWYSKMAKLRQSYSPTDDKT